MKPASNVTDLPETFAVSPRSQATPSRANDFYELTKPRMNFLVVVTTMVGYYMGVSSTSDWHRLVHTLIGTALTAACAAVMNQLIERNYDKLMPRTQNRPIPTGRVAVWEAVVYGVSLGVVGVAYLAVFVNILTAALGLTTVICYLFFYTPMKRRTSLNTVIGAIPGALPPVMGWTAVQNHLSLEALALFGILFIWQMPHFLAIAILYRRDYAAGGFKMLPVVDEDLTITGRQIVLYSVAMIPITMLPALLNMTGSFYFVSAGLLGLGFLYFAVLCALGRTRADARRLFFASIIYLPLLLGAMMMNKF